MAGFSVGGSNVEIPSHHIPGVAWIQTTFCDNHIINSSFLQPNFSISCNSMSFILPSEMSCTETHHLAGFFLPTTQSLTLIQHKFFKLEFFIFSQQHSRQ